MNRLVSVLLGATALLALPSLSLAAGVEAGVLSCNVKSGWGFVFGSSKELNCTFTPAGGAPEQYAGAISKFGIDIGYTASSVIVWTVFAPTAKPGAGALTGDYAGATGSAAVGGGVGANVLLGGFERSVALQPVSIEGYLGLNVAAGIAMLRLHPVS